MSALKIIGAGFGRTGTLSLKVALDTLGFGPCYHMKEVFDNPRHIELWQAAGDGQKVDWGELFAGYRSAVDWPAAAFVEELEQVYPQAKVILTVRDPEKWYESVSNTIYPATGGAVDSAAPGARAHRKMVTTIVWDGTFRGAFEDKARAIDIFKRHIEDVKARVPADRLLVYDVKEGWEPLCRFLQVDVPVDTPFPRVNDTAAFQQRRLEQSKAEEEPTP